jgi:hypothetical protein
MEALQRGAAVYISSLAQRYSGVTTLSVAMRAEKLLTTPYSRLYLATVEPRIETSSNLIVLSNASIELTKSGGEILTAEKHLID